MNTTVFIVEDHLMMQQTLRIFISRMANFEVCGAVSTAEEALEQLENIAPDLMLIDMSLAKMNGADLVRTLQEQWPDLPCVLLSGHGEASYVQQALAAGARGYILKGNPAELEAAFKQIMDGELYLSKALRQVT